MSDIVRSAPRRPAWLYPMGTRLKDSRGDVWEIQPYCDFYPYRVWELLSHDAAPGGEK